MDKQHMGFDDENMGDSPPEEGDFVLPEEDAGMTQEV